MTEIAREILRLACQQEANYNGCNAASICSVQVHSGGVCKAANWVCNKTGGGLVVLANGFRAGFELPRNMEDALNVPIFRGLISAINEIDTMSVEIQLRSYAPALVEGQLTLVGVSPEVLERRCLSGDAGEGLGSFKQRVREELWAVMGTVSRIVRGPAAP